jgi:hypothetical protein
MVGTTVALPRTAFAGLLAAALVLGGVLGIAARSEFDSLTGTPAAAAAAAANLDSRVVVEHARMTVGRGPLVRDPGASGARPRASVHAADHVGLTERLFPVTTAHRIEHGPLP